MPEANDPSSMAGVGMAIAVENGKVVCSRTYISSSRVTRTHTIDSSMRCLANRAHDFISLALSAVTGDTRARCVSGDGGRVGAWRAS